MSEPVLHRTKFRVAHDKELVALAKQLVHALYDEDREKQRYSYVIMLLVDGQKITEEELEAIPSFNMIELAFEYWRAEAYDLYWDLLQEVSNRGTGFGAVELRSDIGSNELTPFGDVRKITIDPATSSVEWHASVDPFATVTLPMAELFDGLGYTRAMLFDAMWSDNAAKLTVSLFGEELAHTLFGNEVGLDNYDLGADAGPELFEYRGGYAPPIQHTDPDNDPIFEAYRRDPSLGSTDGSNFVFVEAPEDLPADFARLDFNMCAGSEFRGGTFEELLAYRDAFRKAADRLSQCGGTIHLGWAEDMFHKKGEPNVFISSDGLKEMSFTTSPNHWGDFEIIAYEL